MTEDRKIEVWKRLLEGEGLSQLPLGMANGRIDLSGSVVPEAEVLGQVRTKAGTIGRIGGMLRFHALRWENLDFTGSRLRNLRFTGSNITNCVFDLCDCQDWRLWATQVSNTSFVSADLRRSALGAVEQGKRNVFRGVNFVRTDLRQIACGSAEFVACRFKDVRLDKVDFQGSMFVDCSFEGDLNEVIFHRHAFRGEDMPANEMKNVDLRGARLHFVEFRNLDMDTVHFPNDGEHIVLRDYRRTLDRLLSALASRSDITGRSLHTDLAFLRKWAGPRQNVGVLSKADIREMVGEIGLQELLGLLKGIQDPM